MIAAAASWNLKDLTEKAKKAPADYLLKKADSWNGSWIVTKIAETETKDAIEIQIRTYEYAAVTEIQGIPKEIPGITALTGKAVPENADQKQITWEITDAGMTGAVLDGTNLKVTNAGTVNFWRQSKTERKPALTSTGIHCDCKSRRLHQSNRSAGADPGGHGPVYRRKRGSCSESKRCGKREPAIS